MSPGPPVDLRSDTVTRPTDEMRRAMAAAEVGDDVFAEDPTVRRLEERTAELLGHERALFVPSGTMGNQIALHLHGRPGGEVVCEADSHILLYEMGAMAVLSGLLPRPLATLDAASLEGAIRPPADYHSGTVLVEIEDTHNQRGGAVRDAAQLEELLVVARRRRLPVHLDGARLFNAAEATGDSVARLAAGFQSVMISLSKALGAPVGSLLVGGADLIAEARRVRKMFGGGMRQAGILAAAGLLALERGPERLAVDHANARALAAGVVEIPGLSPEPEVPPTNIVMVDVAPTLFDGAPAPAPVLVGRLADRGVLAVPVAPARVRFVTHRDVDEAGIRRAVAACREIVSG